MEVFIANVDELKLKVRVDIKIQIGKYFIQTLALVADLYLRGINMIKRFDIIVYAKQGHFRISVFR